jgi:septum formation protein
MKARRGGARRPEAPVLGADQVLACDGRLFDKPANLEAAAEQLRALRGRRHELLSAAVLVEDGRAVWRHVGRVRLEMRGFSEAFLQAYIEAEGDALLDTVGAYRLEGRGAQLFSRIDGDYFSVLGLPLLEVLHVLRGRGVVAE